MASISLQPAAVMFGGGGVDQALSAKKNQYTIDNTLQDCIIFHSDMTQPVII